jgi:surface antigen
MTALQHIQSFFGRMRLLFQRHRIASLIAGQVIIVAVVVMYVLSSVFGIRLFSAFAQISCPSGDTIYTIQPGDTLSTLAAAYGTSSQTLAQDSQISDPNSIYPNQQICVPGNANASLPSQGVPLHNTVNLFPYGQCTWWASQRYQEMHGFFVPWTTNSDAWQWTARAHEFRWQVSSQPSIGAIVNFQPGVQYASSLGHVGVVEQVLSNGDVVTSNMNILGHPSGAVVNMTFHPGSGVTFITV